MTDQTTTPFKNLDLPTLIIPDLHGEIDLLEQALTKFPDHNYVFLGDLVDRGPASPHVVAAVRHLVDQGRAVLLWGNHEDMMVRGVRGHGDLLGCWIMNGGKETIEQYKELDSHSFARDVDWISDNALNWITISTPSGDIFCSHATRPTLTQIHAGGDHDAGLVWVDDKFLWGRPSPHTISKLKDGCVVSVHGHTPQVKPQPAAKFVESPNGNYYLLDIGSCFNGHLAVLDTYDMQVHTFIKHGS